MFKRAKRTERTPERVNLIAKGLAKRIIKQSDREISEKKALILEYGAVLGG